MTPQMIAGLLIAAAGVAVAALGLVQRRDSVLEEAMAGLGPEGDAAAPPADEFSQRLSEPLPVRLLRPVSQRVSGLLAGLLPSEMLARLRRRLVLAGLSNRLTAEEMLTIHALSAVAGVVLGAVAVTMMQGTAALAAGALLVAMGLFGPRGWLDHVRDDRVETIEADLPDVLDLLAISVEAGSGFEQAMAMVVERFGSGDDAGGVDSPLADELGHALREIQLGVARREALENLRHRTQVGDLNAFVTALIQADGLGMPITRVLRTQAAEMRRRRQQRVREKAGQLPVKLLFPMALFIMPALFVVLLGPAALQMVELL